VPFDSQQRLLITGAGIVTPLGLGWRENELAFESNRMAFRPVELFDVSARIAKTAGMIDLPTDRLYSSLSARQEQRVDRGSKMLLLALREALAQAKLSDLSAVDAIVIGTSAGAMQLGERYCRNVRASSKRQPGQLTLVEHYQPHRQMSTIAKELGWHGPIILVSNACASGANAVGLAMEMIRSGRAKRVIAGGYDAVSELVFAGFDTLRALAPSGVPRPFDAARDGLALGEGAAAVVIEAESVAREAIAECCGYHTATDLHHLTQPDPEGKAAIRTMTEACRMAGVQPHEVDYINSHGTGTPFNDVAEGMAIRAWAGDAASGVAVSSTKSAMGHLLGGAGAVETVICVMALAGQWLPGSLNIRELDPVATFDVVRTFRRAKVKVALTNSFGFGGTNATVVMKSA
jgi:3-oxoacyl-[acyl-carrier-protein] synthase II